MKKILILLLVVCIISSSQAQYNPEATCFDIVDTTEIIDFYEVLSDSVDLYHGEVNSIFYGLKITTTAVLQPDDGSWLLNTGDLSAANNLGFNPVFDYRIILNYLLWLHQGANIKFPDCILTLSSGPIEIRGYNYTGTATQYNAMKNDNYYYQAGLKDCNGSSLGWGQIVYKSNNTGLYVYANTSIYFPPNNIIVAPSSQNLNHVMIALSHSCNVTLCGLKLRGSNNSFYIDSTLANYGGKIQDGPGAITISYSKEVLIKNTEIKYASGDGIFITKPYQGWSNNENVQIENASISRSGRNGISIISGKDLYIKDITIDSTGVSKNKGCLSLSGSTSGRLPWTGIDIEPNLTPAADGSNINTIDGNLWVENYLSSENRGSSVGFLGLSNLNNDIKYTSTPLPPDLDIRFCNVTDFRSDLTIGEPNYCGGVNVSSRWSYGPSMGLWILPGGSAITDIHVNGNIHIINPTFIRPVGDNYFVPFTTTGLSSSKLKVNLINPTFSSSYTIADQINTNQYFSKFSDTTFTCENFEGGELVTLSGEQYMHTTADLSVYPNPAKDIIHYYLSEKNAEHTASIYSTDGKKMMETNNPFGYGTLNLTGLPKGIYYLTVKTNNKLFTRILTLQ